MSNYSASVNLDSDRGDKFNGSDDGDRGGEGDGIDRVSWGDGETWGFSEIYRGDLGTFWDNLGTFWRCSWVIWGHFGMYWDIPG